MLPYTALGEEASCGPLWEGVLVPRKEKAFHEGASFSAIHLFLLCTTVKSKRGHQPL